MKKKLNLIIVIAFILLVGCTQNTNEETSKNKDTSTTKEQLILSEYLKFNDNSKIWFYVNEDIEDFGKDTSVSEIYVFKDGKVATYDGDLYSNLGELAQLDDKEILSSIADKQVDYDNTLVKGRIEYIKEHLQVIQKKLDSVSDDLVDFYQAELDYTNKVFNSLETFKATKRNFSPYTLTVSTYNSGNQTKIESLSFYKEILNIPTSIGDGLYTENILKMIDSESYLWDIKTEEQSYDLEASDISLDANFPIYNSTYRVIRVAKNHSRKTTHEVLLKIKTALRDAYARGYLATDFASLVKTRGKELPKRNKSLSITDLKKLRTYLLQNPDNEFNMLALLALETGMRRGELLGIRPENLFEYGIEVRHSISPTSEDTSLKTKNSKRDVSINQEVYNLLQAIPVKDNGYIFDSNGFHQSADLAKLLKKLDIPKTTFHGLCDTHASFLFSKDIDIAYVSKRLGHINIQTTQNYYLELMPEKKHQQDADALNLLNSLSN
ncbi:site-specific integrase [Listeria welshimeri]|nr:site-specific integrase [Listeria welshimeri]